MTRAVGLSRAKELIFTGRMITGEEASKIGLVSHAVERDAFGKALEIGKEILKTVIICARKIPILVPKVSFLWIKPSF